jgi:hypothetical protein
MDRAMVKRTGKGGWKKAPPAAEVTPRDVIQWPYQSYHYWNMPLGEDAVLEPCGMRAPKIWRSEHNLLFLDPDATKHTIYAHTGAWNSVPRCDQTTTNVFDKIPDWNPLPMDKFVLGGDWDDNNQCASFLTYDEFGDIRRVEMQPFIFCPNNGSGTPYAQFSRASMQGGYIDHRAQMPAEGPQGSLAGSGPGIESAGVGGAHAGAGLEAFGGTIRLRHIAAREIDTVTSCILNTAQWLTTVNANAPRWPANRVDAGWANYGTQRPAGTGTAPVGMRMGSLLALPQSFNVAGLSTPAGRMFGYAYQRYGTYVCDGAQQLLDGWFVLTEDGVQGNADTAFASQFGHPLRQRDVDNPTGLSLSYFNDVKSIVQNLHLVADNSSTNIGGAGARVAPMARALPGE